MQPKKYKMYKVTTIKEQYLNLQMANPQQHMQTVWDFASILIAGVQSPLADNNNFQSSFHVKQMKLFCFVKHVQTYSTFKEKIFFDHLYLLKVSWLDQTVLRIYQIMEHVFNVSVLGPKREPKVMVNLYKELTLGLFCVSNIAWFALALLYWHGIRALNTYTPFAMKHKEVFTHTFE